MVDYDNNSKDESDSLSIIPRNEVRILITDEDKTGEDILAMSDFFNGYIQQLCSSLREKAILQPVLDIPFADIGIIGEVIHRAEVVSQGATQLIPDFDNLPKGIKQKLQDGLYKVGESRQVDGNLRAVIVDENGTRVKDITLKEAQINPNTMEASRSIMNQLQMKQIYAKLAAIYEMQSFQIDRDRDQAIKVPFLNARHYILKAQAQNRCITDKRSDLEEASKHLLSAINSVYTDITTSTKHLNKLTRFPILRKTEQIQIYIGFISEDLQLATKLVGLYMQVRDYLGDTDDAEIMLDSYQKKMCDFFTGRIPGRKYSAADLIHQNCSYTRENLNYWHQLSVDLAPFLDTIHMKDNEHIYLVSVEDIQNVKEEKDLLVMSSDSY